MSDFNYPPPSYYPPQPAPVKVRWWKRSVPVWGVILIGLLCIALGGGSNKDTATASAVIAPTTTTEKAAPTTTTTSTTVAPTTTTTTIPPTTTTTAKPGPIVVLDVSGNAATNSDNFTVHGRWFITTETAGEYGAGIGIVIRDAKTNEQVNFLTVPSGGGESSQRGSGTYYLDITPFGSSFHVTVTDVP